MSTESRKIVFYDGNCGFCSATVNYIIEHEKTPELYFAAIQSDLGKKFLEQENKLEVDLKTLYFYDGVKIYTKSTAMFNIAKYLRFPYNMLRLFRIIPRFLCNIVYDIVARYRYKIQLNQRYCILPSDDLSKRFL